MSATTVGSITRRRVVRLLVRTGLHQPIVEAMRLLSSGEERARWRLIWDDYASSRQQFRAIAGGAPAGDGQRPVLMISSMQTVWAIKLEAALGLALRLQGFTPYVLQINPNSWTRRYHRLLGNDRFVAFKRWVNDSESVAVMEVAEEFSTVAALMKFRYRGVDAGRILLSNLMYRHKFSRLDLSAPEMQRELSLDFQQVARNVTGAERMLDRIQPVIALVLEKGVSPVAEIFGACVGRGTPVVQYVGSQSLGDLVLKRFGEENRYQHPFSLDVSTWERVKKMPWGDAQEEQIMGDLTRGYSAGTWFNRKFLHQDKTIKDIDEVRYQLGIDPDRKTAVIFSHVLWDATFFYGDGLFDDYETWFLAAVRAACANPKVNWVIKLHPDLVWKLKYEEYTGELRDVIAMRSAVGSLPDHVKLVMPETDISTYSFFGLTDWCLTVRGTIGIEMACHGVPVITAGTGRYSELGFTYDSHSVDEYLDLLAHIEDVRPMSDQQIELARRFAYALFRQRPWKLRSFEMMKMGIDQIGQPLDNNTVARINSLEEFAGADDIRKFSAWVESECVDFVDADN